MMNPSATAFVKDICENAPTGSKEAVIQYATSKYALTPDRKVYYCRAFAVRFSYSKNGAFSNTVLSLGALQKYDRIPFFVVLVRGNGGNSVFLANSTFISKISHSSKELTMYNIRGSFNGSDIMKSYAGRDNAPQNFEELFAIHEGLDWEDNLERLVDASSAIRPKSQKFNPTAEQINNIYSSVERASNFVASANFCALSEDLNARCNKCAEAIMAASHIENVNLRGRVIEFLITSDEETQNKLKGILLNDIEFLPEFTTRDELGDYGRVFDNGHTYTDIKTKIVYLDSAPKAYNVDKFLQKMAEDDSIFLFFIIGIGQDGILNTSLCSVYHEELIEASVVQHHWAGRSTRGVVQFAGNALNNILNSKQFKNKINPEKAKAYLQCLLAR